MHFVTQKHGGIQFCLDKGVSLSAHLICIADRKCNKSAVGVLLNEGNAVDGNLMTEPSETIEIPHKRGTPEQQNLLQNEFEARK